MTEGDDFDIDSPLTLQDYIEIIENDIEEAVDQFDPADIEHMCREVQGKIRSILAEIRRRKPVDEPGPEPDRDTNDRWWDR